MWLCLEKCCTPTILLPCSVTNTALHALSSTRVLKSKEEQAMLSHCQRLSRALKLFLKHNLLLQSHNPTSLLNSASHHTAPLCPEIQQTASFLGTYLYHSTFSFSTKHGNHNHKDITSISAENQMPICFNGNFKSLNSNRLAETLISSKHTGCLNSQTLCSKYHCVQNGKQHLWNVQTELLFLFFKVERIITDSKAIFSLTYARFLSELRTDKWSKNPHS